MQENYNEINDIKNITRKFKCKNSSLEIYNEIEGSGIHLVELILNAAPNIEFKILDNQINFIFEGKNLCRLDINKNWNIFMEENFYSPFYLKKIPSKRIIISKETVLSTHININFQF